MCSATICENGNECDGCLYNKENPLRKYEPTGLSTKDMRKYKREYMRMVRQERLFMDMQAAGLV